MRGELREIWFVQSPPFFYPQEAFLDLRDGFLTGKLLTREAQSFVSVFAYVYSNSKLDRIFL